MRNKTNNISHTEQTWKFNETEIGLLNNDGFYSKKIDMNVRLTAGEYMKIIDFYINGEEQKYAKKYIYLKFETKKQLKESENDYTPYHIQGLYSLGVAIIVGILSFLGAVFSEDIRHKFGKRYKKKNESSTLFTSLK